MVDVALLGPDGTPFGVEGYWLNAPVPTAPLDNSLYFATHFWQTICTETDWSEQVVFQSYPNPPLFSHPWGFFPFGGVSFENVEIRCAPPTHLFSPESFALSIDR